jgi:hypothetical protein
LFCGQLERRCLREEGAAPVRPPAHRSKPLSHSADVPPSGFSIKLPRYKYNGYYFWNHCWTFQTSFQSASSTCRGMRAGVAEGGLVSPVLFSLHVNDIHKPSLHVELAQYVDDTALTATSRSPSLLVGYLEAYLGRLERWLRDWRIAINVLKNTAVLFIKAARRIRKPRAVQCLGEPIQWVETARYIGVILDIQLTWSANVNQVRKKAAQRLGVLGPLLNRRSGACPSETVCSSSVIRWITHVRSGGLLPSAISRSCKCYNQSVFALRLTHLGTLATGKFTRIWGLHSSPTTSEHWLSFDSKLVDAGYPLFRQLGRHLCWARKEWSHPRVTEEDWCSAGQPRPSLKRRPSRCNG